MASTIATMASSSIAGVALSTPLPARMATRSVNAARMPVRCMATNSNNPIETAKELTKGTKVEITEGDVKANMADESEKASVFGTKPSAGGGGYPRPESERRPELGNTSFGSIMAFDGPGPETINGRLAMTGAAWAVVSELLTHQTIVEQVSAPGSPGLFWLLATAQLLIFASLVPIFNGESPDSRKNGPFTAKAERWNGRLAMIGFAGLLVFERFAGHSFF